MRRLKANYIGVLAFLLAVVLAGCGDPDKNANAGKPGDPLTPPTVALVTPADGTAIVCPDTPIVSASFSKAMNPATLTPATFTLTGPAGPVAGAVTYDATTNTATFATATLAASTKFTATITTGAADTFGNTMEANKQWSFTTSANCDTIPPTVTVTPLDLSTGICPNTAIISATFSKAMDPKTITPATFTLSDPNGPMVGTTVRLGASNVAILTPPTNLALDTQYVATITTGATDTFGLPLAVNKVWTFHTAQSACATVQQPIALGTACNFGILASASVTSTGLTTIAGGDLGISPSTSVTGFPPGILVAPASQHVADKSAGTAKSDLTNAYLTAAAIQGAISLPGDMSGLTLAPGVYKNSSSVLLSAGHVTLDAQGNNDAEFVFQIGSTLTTADASQVILAGGAQAKNIFWQVGSSATLGATSVFEGNIMAQATISFRDGATLNGRALAQTGAVTMIHDSIVAPAPPCQ